MRNFVVPHGSDEASYYSDILRATDNEIIQGFRENTIPSSSNIVTQKGIRLLYAAFRLAGVVDRRLVDEVAKMELSLTRHALYLRHLVLRYAKALMLFLLTTLILIVLAEVPRIPTISYATSSANINITKLVAAAVLVYGLLWVVERTLTWFNHFPRLTICYERRLDIHTAFLELGSALLCWKYLAKTFC